ncbi:hypothetical protein VP01_2217g3 [Puccinia sorghi]|uniref:Uncharacterized protein n=1 Tax=Puccinia sorghi TaxID=27349 RepID=A0A0L6V9E9_9BASI|nr:hypothetical protein VP01_2217g3 [Puccinia sorghi]
MYFSLLSAVKELELGIKKSPKNGWEETFLSFLEKLSSQNIFFPAHPACALDEPSSLSSNTTQSWPGQLTFFFYFLFFFIFGFKPIINSKLSSVRSQRIKVPKLLTITILNEFAMTKISKLRKTTHSYTFYFSNRNLKNLQHKFSQLKMSVWDDNTFWATPVRASPPQELSPKLAPCGIFSYTTRATKLEAIISLSLMVDIVKPNVASLQQKLESLKTENVVFFFISKINVLNVSIAHKPTFLHVSVADISITLLVSIADTSSMLQVSIADKNAKLKISVPFFEHHHKIANWKSFRSLFLKIRLKRNKFRNTTKRKRFTKRKKIYIKKNGLDGDSLHLFLNYFPCFQETYWALKLMVLVQVSVICWLHYKFALLVNLLAVFLHLLLFFPDKMQACCGLWYGNWIFTSENHSSWRITKLHPSTKHKFTPPPLHSSLLPASQSFPKPHTPTAIDFCSLLNHPNSAAHSSGLSIPNLQAAQAPQQSGFSPQRPQIPAHAPKIP